MAKTANCKASPAKTPKKADAKASAAKILMKANAKASAPKIPTKANAKASAAKIPTKASAKAFAAKIPTKANAKAFAAKIPTKANAKASAVKTPTSWHFELMGKKFRLGLVQCRKLEFGEKEIVISQIQILGCGMGYWRFVEHHRGAKGMVYKCTAKSGHFAGATLEAWKQ